MAVSEDGEDVPEANDEMWEEVPDDIYVDDSINQPFLLSDDEGEPRFQFRAKK